MKGVIVALIVFAFGVSPSRAQQYAFCFTIPNYNDDARVGYFTPVFTVPDAIGPHDDGNIGQGEPLISFRAMLLTKYSVSTTYSRNSDCAVFKSQAKANAVRSASRSGVNSNSSYRVLDVDWIYAPMKQGTHTGLSATTEAEALYSAEDRLQGPFENGRFPTIHSWDKHECASSTHKTSNFANAKPVATYTCTVTYSYSDTASPVAKTAIGRGVTQEEAVVSAKASTNDAHWSEPVCSTVFKPNPYKANYGGPREGTTSYVCEVDYTVKP